MAGRKKKSETVQKPSVDLDRSFGPNLRRLRYMRGHSQEKLAQLADVHRTEIGLLEHGERVPRIDTLIRLADSMVVPPGELLDGISWVPAPEVVGAFAFSSSSIPQSPSSVTQETGN